MSYEVVTGRIADPNEIIDDNKIPQKADDLLWPEISLEYRQDYLERINALIDKIHKWEFEYVLGNDDVSESQEIIDCFTRRCSRSNLTGTCENLRCSKGPDFKIPICDNYCIVCKGHGVENIVQRRLSVFRNSLSRMKYLEFQLASSLANQLSRNELFAVLKEIDCWFWIADLCIE